MNRRYIFFEDGKEITEEQIREWDFNENIQDLTRNQKDIKEGHINVESVCECIVNSLNADILTVIEDLNKCWGYNINFIKRKINMDKRLILIDYTFWRVEQELDHCKETIETYISGLFYEIQDNLELERENFQVPKELTDESAIKYIEGEIEKILI